MGRVDGEGLVVSVPGGSRLESTNVGAVAKFGLSIAPNDLVFVGESEPLLLLLRSRLALQCHLHAISRPTRHKQAEPGDIP